MRMFFVIFLLGLCQDAFSQHLFSSKHSTPSGNAEMNSFMVNCEDDCYFTVFLEVTKLDFESPAESGAMFRVWDETRTKYVLFGIKANKETMTPQITIVSSNSESEKALVPSELGAFEGFQFKWKGGKFRLNILRRVKMNGYSQIKESDIFFEDKLFFNPRSVEYLFLGADLTQHIDASSQNINSEWTRMVNGS
ncbi:hypothetical protein ACOI22_13675 [Glaciecola sp. 2405UD65-10]|uniref:hypothetical protein n=1 Tax=Glaciecola sp. 2405UD65-10 TaxID=3397244 RepID=UPI003B5B4AF7